MVITADVIGFATLASTLLALVVFTLSNSKKHEEGRKGIYKRIDQERNYNSVTYLRQDVHDAKYEAMERDVSEIKIDVKKLLSKNGIK